MTKRSRKPRRQKKRRYSPSSLTHHVSGTIRGLRRPRVIIDPELRWYVLVTAPKRERQVEGDLSREGVPVYVPRMAFEVVRRGRRSEREKLPVGGYLFAGLPEDREPAFADVDGVSGVLSMGLVPLVVQPEAVQAFSDILTGSRPDIAEEFDGRFKVGDKARVTEGPFQGHVSEVDALLWTGQVRALVKLFGRATPVNFAPNQLATA